MHKPRRGIRDSPPYPSKDGLPEPRRTESTRLNNSARVCIYLVLILSKRLLRRPVSYRAYSLRACATAAGEVAACKSRPLTGPCPSACQQLLVAMGAGASAGGSPGEQLLLVGGGRAKAGREGPLDSFTCPITGDIMSSPVMTSDGHT